MTITSTREHLSRFNFLISPNDSDETAGFCEYVTENLCKVKDETLRTILKDLVQSALNFEKEVDHV